MFLLQLRREDLGRHCEKEPNQYELLGRDGGERTIELLCKLPLVILCYGGTRHSSSLWKWNLRRMTEEKVNANPASTEHSKSSGQQSHTVDQ